jgi:hypothetical protein
MPPFADVAPRVGRPKALPLLAPSDMSEVSDVFGRLVCMCTCKRLHVMQLFE